MLLLNSTNPGPCIAHGSLFAPMIPSFSRSHHTSHNPWVPAAPPHAHGSQHSGEVVIWPWAPKVWVAGTWQVPPQTHSPYTQLSCLFGCSCGALPQPLTFMKLTLLTCLSWIWVQVVRWIDRKMGQGVGQDGSFPQKANCKWENKKVGGKIPEYYLPHFHFS